MKATGFVYIRSINFKTFEEHYDFVKHNNLNQISQNSDTCNKDRFFQNMLHNKTALGKSIH